MLASTKISLGGFPVKGSLGSGQDCLKDVLLAKAALEVSLVKTLLEVSLAKPPLKGSLFQTEGEEGVLQEDS